MSDRTRGSPHDYPYSDGNAQKKTSKNMAIENHGKTQNYPLVI